MFNGPVQANIQVKMSIGKPIDVCLYTKFLSYEICLQTISLNVKAGKNALEFLFLALFYLVQVPNAVWLARNKVQGLLDVFLTYLTG